MRMVEAMQANGVALVEALKVWIVVQAKPGQSVIAEEQLTKQGFEVYLPMTLFTNKRGETVGKPFLGRYLFARVTLQVDHWKCIFRTRGVHTVLGGQRPYGVSDWAVERIRLQEDDGFIRLGLAAETGLHKGQKLRYSLGNCDIEALFIEMVDERRALILVSLLGRDSKVRVDLRTLKARTLEAH